MDASVAMTTLEAKATLFSLLAQAMNYPDAKLVESLQGGTFTNTLCEALSAIGDPSLNSLLESCAKEFSLLSANDALLELERDYTRMFFSSKPRLAHLFESVYREGKLLQESTFAIAGLYLDAGLKLSEDFRLPPDHIAVELEFLSFLLFKEMEGLKAGDYAIVDYARELQHTVIDEHLRPFGLNIAERVEQHAKTSFYRTVAQVLKRYYSRRIPD